MHRTDTAAERPAPATAISIALLLLSVLLLAACGGRRDRVAAEPLSIRTPMPTFTPTPTVEGGAPAQAQAIVVAPVESASAPADLAPIPQVATPEAPGTGGPVGPIEPLPPAAQPADASQPAAETQPAPLAAAPAFDPPLGVINTELVNGRSAPDATGDVVLVLGRGEEYDITGKSSSGEWLRLCCAQEREVWAFAEFVDTDGLIDSLPVAEAGPLSTYAAAILAGAAQPAAPVAVATPEPPPVAPPPAVEAPAPAAETASTEADPAAASRSEQPAAEQAAAGEGAPAQPDAVQDASAAASAGYELVAQERFPETNVVRVFLYVYAENQALEGYSLRVTKDGAEQAVSGESWGGQAGLTWPIADERQRSQNFKVEFPGVSAAGTWTVELTQGGSVVGPAASFTLVADETAQELYVRYLRK